MVFKNKWKRDLNLTQWPKQPISWIEGRTNYVTIPFTWNLPQVKKDLNQGNLFYDQTIVGGPATFLMPDFFKDLANVSVGRHMPGILQRVNPYATRTTLGCIRKCEYCVVHRAEKEFRLLDDWPDLPVICDDQLIAAPLYHFEKVIERLVKWKVADFQALDCRPLSPRHARLMAKIKWPMIRLAADNANSITALASAMKFLTDAGIAKKKIRVYALTGYNTGPDEAWWRTYKIESFGVRVLPTWYHRLDALGKNIVTEDQKNLGWTDEERKRIMAYWYWRRESNVTRKKGRKK